MKKKLLFTLGIAAAAGAVFFSTNVEGSSEETTLKNLIAVNSANAECEDKGDRNNGKCLTLSKICVGDPGNNECLF